MMMALKKQKKVTYSSRQIEKMNLKEYLDAFLIEGTWTRNKEDPIRESKFERHRLYKQELVLREELAENLTAQKQYRAIAEAVKGDTNDPSNAIHAFYEEDRIIQLEEAKSYLVGLKENLEASADKQKDKLQNENIRLTLGIMRLELNEPELKNEYVWVKQNDYACEHYNQEMVEISQSGIAYIKEQRLALCIELFGNEPPQQLEESSL